jgi:hypothetical protein
MNRKISLGLLSVYFFSFGALAQHNPDGTTRPVSTHDLHGMKGSHRLTLGLGHTHVSQGKVDGETRWLVLPSWSINYDYWITNKWAVGLQTDLITETFLIESNDGEEFERASPIAVVPVAMFKSGKHWSFIVGVGGEFAREHDFALTRLGIEYGWHLPKNWELGAALVWDNKWNYYNSWGLAFTISKIWPKKQR